MFALLDLITAPTESSGRISRHMSVTPETKSSKSRAKAEIFDARGITLSTYRGAVMPEPIASKSGNRWSGPGAVSICLQCSKEIRHKPSQRRKYCSKDCRIEFERQLAIRLHARPCAVCEAPVYRPPAHLKRSGEHFCSRKCFAQANVGARNPAFRTGRVTLKCQLCGESFKRKHGDASKAKFCSPQCVSRFTWKHGSLSDRVLPDMQCQRCGETFHPNTLKRQFCSDVCSSAAHAHRIAGKGNGRYVHGQATRKYPPGWTRNHKAAIRARDGGQCQCCGRSRDPHRDLDVHHIDYDKTNLAPQNLITLCRYCHGKMHGSEHQRAKWTRELSRLVERSEAKASSTTCALPHATTTLPAAS